MDGTNMKQQSQIQEKSRDFYLYTCTVCPGTNDEREIETAKQPCGKLPAGQKACGGHRQACRTSGRLAVEVSRGNRAEEGIIMLPK